MKDVIDFRLSVEAAITRYQRRRTSLITACAEIVAQFRGELRIACTMITRFDDRDGVAN